MTLKWPINLINETNAKFTFENFTLSCRLIEGKYPNYEAVIPRENPNKLVIERVLLLNSVKESVC